MNQKKFNLKTFLNNNWFVSSIFFSIGILLSTPDSINLKNVDYIYGVFINIRIMLIICLLYLLIIIFTVRILNNRTFYFADENFLYQFPSYIKLVYLLKKKKNAEAIIKQTLNEFNNYDKPYFGLDNSSTWCNSNQFNINKSPHVIYKIPARTHISIPDLIDLRLLKKLICNGIKVSVIVIDIPYTINNGDFRHAWSKVTKQRVLSILGKSTNVFYLTELLSLNPNESFKIVCTDVIPFFAKGTQFKSNVQTPDDIKQIENVSHAGKSLLLISLNSLINSKENVFVIQYIKRVKSWDLYYEVYGDKLKVFTNQTNFITVDSFLDPNGNIFKPFVKDYDNVNNFNLTDDFNSICKKVFSKTDGKWSVPTEYIINVCRIVFGVPHKSYEIRSKKISGILEKIQDINMSFLNEDIISDKNIIWRYFLLKEIKRLQKRRYF
jgi:hypothetical protein